MARTNNLTDFLTDVATAIKTKKGSETAIPASNFDTEIANLPSQGTYQEKTVSVGHNGTTTVVPDQGYDAIDELTITTAVPLQSRNYSFTQNTITTLTPEQGYDGFSSVGLEINVSGGGSGTILNVGGEDVAVRDRALIFGGTTPYTELEYLQATGTQYVDIGIVPNQNTEVEIKFKLNAIPASNEYIGLFGSAVYNAPKWFRYIIAGSSKWGFQMANRENLSLVNCDTNIHTIKFGKGKVIDNGIQIYSNTIDNFTGISMYLFATHIDVAGANPQWVDYITSFNIYYCKVYQNDILVQDLIPVKDRTNFYAMYDKIHDIYYYNIGSGTFVPGSEVEE